MAVLTQVDATADVDPPTAATVLQDQLVVVHAVAHVIEHGAQDLLLRLIAPRPVLPGDDEVGGLTQTVLRGVDASHKVVHQRTTVAAGDLERELEMVAGGLQHALTEVLQGCHVALQRNVRYRLRLVPLCLIRPAHLPKCEIFRQPHIHVYW